MADNIAVTPGVGASVATDEVLGSHYQRMKIVTGAEGVVVGDVSDDNPLPTKVSGEVVEALEAIRSALDALTRTIGMSYPDLSGRMRVAIDAISASLTLATITTVGTVTTVATVTNQAQVGGVPATQQMPAILQISAESLRRNITVT